MKENEITEIISNHMYNHEQQWHSIFLFDCPNCGHQTPATKSTITTGEMLKTYSYQGTPYEYPEVTQCLTCGKKFTKEIEWKEVKD